MYEDFAPSITISFAMPSIKKSKIAKKSTFSRSPLVCTRSIFRNLSPSSIIIALQRELGGALRLWWANYYSQHYTYTANRVIIIFRFSYPLPPKNCKLQKVSNYGLQKRIFKFMAINFCSKRLYQYDDWVFWWPINDLWAEIFFG